MRLKRSLIIPIHKSGSQGGPSNFRPISLTSHLIKTIERVIRVKLVNFLELGSKLDPRQHGSRAHISTLSQLLEYQDDILKSLEDDDNLDFSRAYDKVDHGILLHKMKKMGITGMIGMYHELPVRKRARSHGKRKKISSLPPGLRCPSGLATTSL